MNRSGFISYLKNPEKLSGDNATDISNIVKDFPYFQTAHLLYVKNLYNQNSIQYDRQLKIAAAYSGDRKVLYNLIHSKNTVITQAIEEKKNTDTVELPKTQISKPIVDRKQEITEPKISSPTFSELEKGILSEAISSSIELEVDEIISKENINVQDDDTSINQTIQEQSIVINKNDKYSFSDWLKITNKNTSDKEKQEIIEQKSTEELINKFITEQPRITKPKAEFFSPVNLARKSVIESNEIVSETLAKIYEKQGNYTKAIKAYESLSLKYPEKKLFFAARIKELKKKLIS